MALFSFLQSQLIAVGSSDSFQRMLQDSTGDNKNPSNPDDGRGNPVGGIAFLVWYAFLIFCCTVPTCCAYRRRRLLEQRFEQREAYLHRNFYNLSNLQRTAQMHSHDLESLEQERLRAITDELKETTMIIKAENIETLPASESSPLHSESDTRAAKDDASVDEGDDGAVLAMESGATPENDDATTELDHEIDCADYTEHNGLVRLPPDAFNANRTVPGVCAICLGPYAEGDEVSWSPKANCQHAFHTDCIIPWLAKTSEPKCPVCRQEFCSTVVVDEAIMEPDYEREASFLESFSQALALSQIYRSNPSESDIRDMSDIELELTNLAIRNQTANAAMESGLHIASEPARNASPSADDDNASSSSTTESYTRERPSSEIDQGTDDGTNVDSNSTTHTR